MARHGAVLRFVPLVALPGLLAATLLAQTSGQPDPAPAVVVVDFLALGADGSPVGDLTAAEVSLRVDGKVRPIKALEFVKMEHVRPAPGAAAETPVPPPYGSNVLTDTITSRALVIVIEDESLEVGGEPAMREAIGLLLVGLSARDRVAVVTVPHGGLTVDFTTDHERVRKAVWAITGQAPRNESPDDASCRTRDTLTALTGLLDSMSGGHGPTTVLFFSSGLTGPSQMTMPPAGVAGQQQPLIGRCVLRIDEFQHIGAAAETARANFYIVPPHTSPIAQRFLEGIENLASVTGGARLGMASVAETALSRVSRETAGYYAATFTPEPAERNGLNHRIDVRVSRSGVQVRTRPGLPIPKPGFAESSNAAAAPAAARDLLRENRIFRELPLRVAGYTSRQAGTAALRVVGLAEAMDPDVKLRSASMGLFDGQGQLVAQWSADAVDLPRRPMQAALLVPAGTYKLRATATDTFGRRGTAEYEIDASLLPAGTLRLSSIAMGLSRDGRFLPRLEFGSESSAMVQLEIYGGQAGTPIGAMLELAESAHGQPLLTARLVLDATPEPDRFTAKGTVPIGALPAGDFVVRAIVEMEGQPAGRVIATIRKRIR